jgi:hypothetical protein
VKKIKIRTVDEFELVLKTLCLDLATASDHYALFQKLLAAREGAYSKALSQSQTFWSLTYDAHFETAVFRLCRAYDQDSDALALKGFLEAIRANPGFLPTPQVFQRLDQKQLDADLEWVSQDTNQVVKHLMMWRHKVYAHRDIRKTVSGDLAADYPVTHDDVANLLEQGFSIVNRYNAVFFRSHFAREILGLEDYQKVLRILQDRVEMWEAQFEAERQRAAREGGTG